MSDEVGAVIGLRQWAAATGPPLHVYFDVTPLPPDVRELRRARGYCPDCGSNPHPRGVSLIKTRNARSMWPHPRCWCGDDEPVRVPDHHRGYPRPLP